METYQIDKMPFVCLVKQKRLTSVGRGAIVKKICLLNYSSRNGNALHSVGISEPVELCSQNDTAANRAVSWRFIVPTPVFRPLANYLCAVVLFCFQELSILRLLGYHLNCKVFSKVTYFMV